LQHGLTGSWSPERRHEATSPVMLDELEDRALVIGVTVPFAVVRLGDHQMNLHIIHAPIE